MGFGSSQGKKASLEQNGQQDDAEYNMKDGFPAIIRGYGDHNRNTMEAAPLRPAQEIRTFWRNGALNGANKRNTAAGLAKKVKNKAVGESREKISPQAGREDQEA